VISGRLLRLPTIGDLPLAGVLRSELQAHLTEQIGRFVRNPVVRARSLIRLEILGSVGAPGFYIVPSDVLVTDALMIAGGPHPDADVDRLRITRGSSVIWDGDALRQAVIDGRTLDQLNVQAGDGIYVPGRKSFMSKIAPITGILGGIASLVLIGTQVF
jgi:protein involved in polysaccharide export with SLBB domain